MSLTCPKGSYNIKSMSDRPNLTEEEKEHYNKVAMDIIYNKTPRTDKAEPQIRFIKSGWVRSDFAREMELELNALKKKLDDSKFGAQCSVHELEYDRKTLIKENQNIKSSCADLIEAGNLTLKQRDDLMKALKSLICTAEKDEINKNHLDVALRKARNVIADIDPTIEKCDCCY